MDKTKLLKFLIDARSKTYAGSGKEVEPSWLGGHQYEFKDGDWLYRDFYNLGNGIFMGLETIYLKDKPVWSNCYYGNFKSMTEAEVDKILRGALVANKDKARLWFDVEWKNGDFTYLCKSDFAGSLDEIAGSEEIYKGKTKVYFLFYAGGFIG